jgi:hypothetical protein
LGKEKALVMEVGKGTGKITGLETMKMDGLSYCIIVLRY